MFSGIVEEIGKVTDKKKISEGYNFKVKSKKIGKKLKVSDSVSINGVCHTVTSKKGNEFGFTTMHETLKKTNIGMLEKGSGVNLESSLYIGKELGGHFVLGHIDCTGTVSSVKVVNEKDPKSKNWEYWIKAESKFADYVINVGSIAVDGVSLTVADMRKPKGKFFEIKVAIIPYTYDNTNFGIYKEGDKVNLEFDFLGKYVLNVIKSRRKVK